MASSETTRDLAPEIWDALPRPLLPARPHLVEAYRGAWAIAAEKGIRAPHPAVKNGETFLDACFSDNIFQWDSCFLTFWGRYAQGALPGLKNPMSCLDNFYALREESGAIAREYRPDGTPEQNRHPDQDTDRTPDHARHTALTNPPLFSWAEWEFYEHTGDDARLPRVFPVLKKYFDWYRKERRHPEGYFWYDAFGSGMDNCPRGDAWGWVDYTAQAALDCEFLANMALYLEDHPTGQLCSEIYLELKEIANESMYNEMERHYCDVDEDELWTGPLHAGAFWVLMASLAPPSRVNEMTRHLRSRRGFGRENLIPNLAAKTAEFNSKGNYWRGGVWPPIVYMTVRALDRCGHRTLAREIAANHAELCARVYKDTGSFWENYAPDEPAPGDPARPDFCGWSALGPIALLIEFVLGVRVNGVLGEVHWTLLPDEPHGIENLLVAGVPVDLHAEPDGPGEWQVRVRAGGPVGVFVKAPSGTTPIEFDEAGEKAARIR